MTDEQLQQLDAEWTALPELGLDRNALRDKSDKTLLMLAMADTGAAGATLSKCMVEARTLVPQLITLLQVSRSVSSTMVNQKRDVIEENEALRQVISDAVAALGNGSTCSAKASLEFIKDVPDEVRVVVERLKSEQVSTMSRLTARIRELEQAVATAYAADPPTAVSPIAKLGHRDRDVLPGAVCRWCDHEGIQDYDKPGTVCPRCQESIFTGPPVSFSQEGRGTPYRSPQLAQATAPSELSRYKVLQDGSAEGLCQQVEQLVGQGWWPAGGISVTSRFYQAIER